MIDRFSSRDHLVVAVKTIKVKEIRNEDTPLKVMENASKQGQLLHLMLLILSIGLKIEEIFHLLSLISSPPRPITKI